MFTILALAALLQDEIWKKQRYQMGNRQNT
jgi:hypothetical protein